MNDDKKFKDTFDEHIPSSPNGVGNKGVTSTGGGNSSDSDSHLHHQFSFMGPNHNNNLHQYHSGNSQHHHGHRQDNKIGGGLGITINSNNGNSNDGIMSSHSNNSNQLNNNNSSNGISNGNSSSSSSNFSSEVCRDFLRNVCRRGANCRYRHPEGSEAEELGKKVDLIFCHDFQNKECRRSNCRFIHCTKQEEDIYRVTGKLPTHLIEKLSYSRLTASSSPSPTSSSSGSFHLHHHPLHQSQQQSTDFMKSVTCDNSTTHRLTSNSLIASTLASSFVSSFASTLSSSVASSSTVASPFSNPVPVCKDNLKGDCLRGLRCKFRHISQAEYDLELRSVAVYSAGGLRPSPMDRNHFHHHHAPSSGSPMDGPTSYQGGLAPPEPKRRAYDASLASQPSFNHALPPPHSHSQRTISSLNHQGLSSIQSSTPNDFEFSKPPPPPNQTFFNTNNNNNRYHLEDENLTLRRHIDELKKQVSDLMASNEFLMEQNAQLRTLGTRSTTPLPPSTLHSNSTTSAPQLSLSKDSFIGSRIVDHHQQHLPVALTTSLKSQSMGGIPVSSMATLSNNVLNNSTNPLVSYPIMTATIQSLRPPTIPHSLSH